MPPKKTKRRTADNSGAATPKSAPVPVPAAVPVPAPAPPIQGVETVQQAESSPSAQDHVEQSAAAPGAAEQLKQSEPVEDAEGLQKGTEERVENSEQTVSAAPAAPPDEAGPSEDATVQKTASDDPHDRLGSPLGKRHGRHESIVLVVNDRQVKPLSGWRPP